MGRTGTGSALVVSRDACMQCLAWFGLSVDLAWCTYFECGKCRIDRCTARERKSIGRMLPFAITETLSKSFSTSTETRSRNHQVIVSPQMPLDTIESQDATRLPSNPRPELLVLVSKPDHDTTRHDTDRVVQTSHSIQDRQTDAQTDRARNPEQTDQDGRKRACPSS